MNKATFLAVQLNVDDVAASPGLVELLNTHLVFAADVAEAADALVQLASIAGLSSGVEAQRRDSRAGDRAAARGARQSERLRRILAARARTEPRVIR